MEMKMFLLLPLLLCSVSTAELQVQSDINKVNDSVSPLKESVKESVKESEGPVGESKHEHQTCTQDINVVLRRMSAWVAALKVEVQHLQRDNEVKSTELQSLNQRYQEQETRLKAQADDLAAVKDKTEKYVEALKREGEAQAAELATVKDKANITRYQVEALKREAEAKHLAFSVSLVLSGGKETGPFSIDITLVFKYVITNIGNAYNSETGLFTAPVRGVYHFEVHLYGHGSTSPVAAGLIKNGKQICTSWSHQSNGSQKSSNGASVLLEIGDVVFVRMWAKSWVYDNYMRHTTFSGHLLFTM